MMDLGLKPESFQSDALSIAQQRHAETENEKGMHEPRAHWASSLVKTIMVAVYEECKTNGFFFSSI